MRERGFTVTKVLAALAAVVCLALLVLAVAPPCGCGDRRRAEITQCLSNLRQLGTALQVYSADYDQCLPPAQAAHARWGDLLLSYTKTPAVMDCPAIDTEWQPGGTQYSYALNTTDGVFGDEQASPLRLPQVPEPAARVFIGDSIGGWRVTGPLALRAGKPAWHVTSPAADYVARHQGRLCFAFLDGHAKAVTPEQMTVAGARLRVRPDQRRP